MFKYRNYNLEMNRWTSADPTGFPDGANNNVYCSSPTSEIDFQGMWSIKVTFAKATNLIPAIDLGPTMTGGKGTIEGSTGITGGVTSGQTASSFSIYTGMTGTGIAHILDPSDDVSLDATVTINVSESGSLYYTVSGDVPGQKREDSISVAVGMTASGENTSSMTLHCQMGGALNGGTITGAGFSETGGALTFGGTSYSYFTSGGDYHFEAVGGVE
ncbi:MAG: hypothetical protein PHC88_12615 [Terrimicrobiaceae bacterium]|nr:hypothetical protein [Terrimicrobiaceae bacterium]